VFWNTTALSVCCEGRRRREEEGYLYSPAAASHSFNVLRFQSFADAANITGIAFNFGNRREDSHGWGFLLFPRTVDAFTGEFECRGPNPSPIRFNVLEVPRSSTALCFSPTTRRKDTVIALFTCSIFEEPYCHQGLGLRQRAKPIVVDGQILIEGGISKAKHPLKRLRSHGSALGSVFGAAQRDTRGQVPATDMYSAIECFRDLQPGAACDTFLEGLSHAVAHHVFWEQRIEEGEKRHRKRGQMFSEEEGRTHSHGWYGSCFLENK
jgi:hypothetical protein